MLQNRHSSVSGVRLNRLQHHQEQQGQVAQLVVPLQQLLTRQ
jgi:hypothetical protein